MLWDWEQAIPVEIASRIVYDPDYPPQGIIPPAGETAAWQVTGLVDEVLRKYGVPSATAYHETDTLIYKADYIMGFNSTSFDKLFWEAEAIRQNDPGPAIGSRPPWLDMNCDAPYPDQITTRKLKHLAAEHGFLNPFSHRAVFDVLTMLRIASCYSLEEIVALSLQPIVQLRAKVSYDDRELAKERGYRWFPKKKWWVKTMKEGGVARELTEAEGTGFTAIVLEGPLLVQD